MAITTVLPGGQVPVAPEAPQVDLFKQYGGWSGLIGLNSPLKPGTYKLSDILGFAPASPSPSAPQFSRNEATQNLVQTLAQAANTGRVSTSGQALPLIPTMSAPLSPASPTRNTKGSNTNYLQDSVGPPQNTDVFGSFYRTGYHSKIL